MSESSFGYDVIVIGSGFGGSNWHHDYEPGRRLAIRRDQRCRVARAGDRKTRNL